MEAIIDGNICRCTGYRSFTTSINWKRGSGNRKHFSSVIDLRPIFDAFKSFSPDATERLKKKREAVRKVYIIVPPHTELTNFFYFLI